MNEKRQISIIVILIAVLAGVASFIGIFVQFGDGSFIYQSIRGHDIEIYGRGLYQHMPSDVAVQGIAQDYVTLFIAIPLLLISLLGYLKNSIQSFYLLSGVLGYFFVTLVLHGNGYVQFSVSVLCNASGSVLFRFIYINQNLGTYASIPVF